MDHHTTISPLIRYPPSNNSLLSSGNTKKAITYEPRTEAISPAINDDLITAEDSTSKSTKDEQTLLVDKLKKVEAEILQTDNQIVRLRKQKAQLEQAAASCSSNDDDDQENVCDTKQLSIAKLVYHENRAKAMKAHAKLDCFGGSNRDLPIYNQPSDNAIYHHNVDKFTNSFKNLLIACFRIRLKSRLKLEETVSAEYDNRMEKWLKSIEQDDSQPNKRVKDAKTREFFEKQFPELKKARESGERFSRVGQRVARSDAELDELLDGITEREDQDKKVKSYAVIPPMLEEMRSRKPKFINTNGFVEDIIAEYKEYQILNTWTDEEKELFRENYLQHPKNFGLIASIASRKNVANCVQYYYLSKKSENYKQLLKRQQKRRTRSFVRPAPAISTTINTNNSEVATNNGDSTKVNGFNSNDKQTSDKLPNNINNEISSASTDQQENPKMQTAPNQIGEKQPIGQDGDIEMQPIDGDNYGLACCICNCLFNDSNQFRNVTKSNHQLYGIGLDFLKPEMKICYPCRFRHVKNPSFEEPLMDHELRYEDIDDDCHKLMVVESEPTSVEAATSQTTIAASTSITNITNSACSSHVNINNTSEIKIEKATHTSKVSKEIPEQGATAIMANNNEFNKGQQLTSVRDIIFQAIEMSFQTPNTTDSIEATQPKLEDTLQPQPQTQHQQQQLLLPPQQQPQPPPQLQLPQQQQEGARPGPASIATPITVPSVMPTKTVISSQIELRPPPVAHGGKSTPTMANIKSEPTFECSILDLSVKNPDHCDRQAQPPRPKARAPE